MRRSSLMRSVMLAAALLCTPSLVPMAPAAEWDMDKQITETNVVLGAGGKGFCSGTIISIKHRIVLTAAHCVKDQVKREDIEDVDPVSGEVRKRTIQKKLDLEIWQNVTKDYELVSSRHYLAKVKGVNKQADVAILQVTDESYVPTMAAPLAADSAPMKRGMTVYIIGNPGIEFDNSITKGILSAPERSVDFNDGDGPVKLFQVDAASTGGNSGGQVVNENGELIGTLTGGLRGVSINFAAPIKQTKKLLIDNGFRDVVDPKAGNLNSSANKLDDK